MQFPDEKIQTCWSCERQPATAKYTLAGRTEMVCEACLDRLKLQDEYEYKFRDIIFPLQRNEQYDEALAWVDAFLEANRHRDHDKWLARSIASTRASILFDAGRYAETEQACEARAELGFADDWERCWNCTRKARALDELGRPREGLAILEDALTHQDPKYLPTARDYLEDLAGISEKLGQPVDPKWRSLAEDVAEYYRVEMPKHESLGKAILELEKTIRKKDPTYQEEEGEDIDDEDYDEP
jgi:tetratricopeptide (TPR) repeat protein